MTEPIYRCKRDGDVIRLRVKHLSAAVATVLICMLDSPTFGGICIE